MVSSLVRPGAAPLELVDDFAHRGPVFCAMADEKDQIGGGRY